MKIKKEIHRRFNVDLDVERITLRLLGYRRIRLRYFGMVLKRIHPKAVVLVTSYGKEDLIEAAKSLGVVTIELQHGVIHSYHPGYSFPGDLREKSTFPHALLVFGDYWLDSAEYPIGRNRILSVGYPYLEEELKKYSRTRKEKQILVISQWTIGAELSKFAAELSEVKDLGYRIIYKLHPLEYTGWHEKYPWLSGAEIDVIVGSRKSIYELFAESSLQIGVYSTAVYEGLAFGLGTFIPDVHGADYSESLVEAGVAIKVKSVQELVQHVREAASFRELDREKFFRSGARSRIVRILTRLVSSRKNP
ncbi:MAG: hypothetical protein ACFFAY_15780 [Promethearchaeota archaeon]